MPFSFTTNKRIAARWDGSNFVEQDLTVSGLDGIVVSENADAIIVSGTQVLRSGDTMTGFLTLSADPTANLHAATKQYVDNAVGGALDIQSDNVTIVSGTSQLDFGHALDVTSGTGEALIAVDESEFTTVVFLSGDQTISGNKTFANNVIVQGDLAVSGTVLTTEALLVEDNFVILNSTVTGSPLLNAGVLANRGSSTDAILQWNESTDQWEAGISGSALKIILSSDLNAASGTLQADINSRVLKAGDTMTGDLTLSGSDLLTLTSGTGSIGGFTAPFAAAYFNQAFAEFAPTVPTELANKAYVDAQVASAAVAVHSDGSPAVSGAGILNFTHALDVVSGVGQATISVDESEFTTVVFLTGNQTISGTKTFAAPVVLASGTEPTTMGDTGTSGELRWADDYLYLCVATNTWKRSALAGF
jgi:hypothetical protein